MSKEKPVLTLALKRKWFEEIKSGVKTEEYRLVNEYWKKRLVNRKYDKIVFTLGYPKRDDTERRIEMIYMGYSRKTIVSEEWSNEPKEVFVIHFERIEKSAVEKELKPCPFCGGDPRLEEGGINDMRFFEVTCIGCGITRGRFLVPIGAVSTWNTRKDTLSRKKLKRLVEIAEDSVEDVINEYYNDYFSRGNPLQRNIDGMEDLREQQVFIQQFKKEIGE